MMMRTLIETPARATAILGARALSAPALRFISKISRRVFIGALIALAAVFVAFLYFSELLSVRTVSAAPQSSDKVYLGTPALAAVPAVEKPQMLEMHIANNGLVLLRGATVISNARGTIRVRMAWGGADFTWIVDTNSGTQYFTSEGTREAIEDINVGDTVTVTGKLKGSGAEPVVAAEYVRE